MYLTARSYKLQTGQAEKSRICSVTQEINCDPALLSPYSRIFGMSLSAWGFAFNFFLALILFLPLLGFMAGGASWKNTAFGLALIIVSASLVMMLISLVKGLICPLCWLTYVLSGLSFATLIPPVKGEISLVSLGKSLLTKPAGILAALIAGTAFFTHISFVTVFGIKDLKAKNAVAMTDWQAAKPLSFKHPPLLKWGAESSSMTVVEFADFLCPHCKTVSPRIQRFLKNHPDVAFHFYSYPLDKTCNPEMQAGAGGLSCELTKALICGKKWNKGELIHDLIFERQEKFIKNFRKKEKISRIMEDMIQTAGLSPPDFADCMKSEETTALLEQAVETGNTARIPGTPSFFINGKLWRNQGDLEFNLQTLYNHLN